MIGRGGGVEEAVRNRVRCAWCKFRELYPLLAMRGFPLKLKGKIYKACETERERDHLFPDETHNILYNTFSIPYTYLIRFKINKIIKIIIV